MTYCILAKCQEREDQLGELIIFLFNLLEKSLIPTDVNIVCKVISHNSILPLK